MMLMEVKKLSRSEKSVVTLVVDRDTGSRYVRKELRGAHPVYRWSRDKTALRCWKST